MGRRSALALTATVVLAGLATLAWNSLRLPSSATWSDEELRLIASLSLDALPPLPADPSNAVADSEAAAQLGYSLYFDTRLSANGAVSCASCHKPDLMFTDGLKLAVGAGLGSRHTPSLLGLSYSPWFYWDGRKDSQWAQALAPLEAKHEHGITRSALATLMREDSNYAAAYEAVFGELPAFEMPAASSPLGSESERSAWEALRAEEKQQINEVFANLGKALAAYQRRLMPSRARFDEYAATLAEKQSAQVKTGSALSDEELAGLRLFLGKGMCVTCHNGPLFTNHEFHNTGVLANPGELPAMARYDGVREARKDPFNCLGEYSDASADQCIELRFARDTNDLVGAHKTPTLRSVALTAPYMHGGQIADLAGVMRHYNQAPTSMLSHNEAKPLSLRPPELRALEAFMHTLTAPLATEPRWLEPPQ